jgi:hypothetical protein
MVAEGDIVMVHGRTSGGTGKTLVAVDIFRRFEDGKARRVLPYVPDTQTSGNAKRGRISASQGPHLSIRTVTDSAVAAGGDGDGQI